MTKPLNPIEAQLQYAIDQRDEIKAEAQALGRLAKANEERAEIAESRIEAVREWNETTQRLLTEQGRETWTEFDKGQWNMTSALLAVLSDPVTRGEEGNG